MKYIFSGLLVLVFSTLAGCNASNPPDAIACTQEAKMCPDGSAVGRSGPKCEFAPCPASKP